MTLPDRWPLHALMRESLRNLISSRRRLVPLIYFAVFAGAMVSAVSALDGLSLTRDLARLNEEGRNVIVFTSATETATVITRESCEDLTRLPNVTRSGIVLPSSRSEVVPIGASVPIVEASASLFPELKTSTALVGDGLNASSALRRAVIASVSVSATLAPHQPAGLPTNQAVVVTAPPYVHSADRCIVVLSAGSNGREMLPILRASLNVSAGPVVGAPVLAETIDRLEGHFLRLTVWLPVAMGLVGGLATLAAALTRSSEFASYRLSGTSGRSLFLMGAFECAVLAGVMVATTSVFSSALYRETLSVSSTILLAAGGAGVWQIVGFIGLAITSRQSLLTMTKER